VVIPTSCKIILELLDKARTQQELIQLSGLAQRTVRYALSKLLKEGIISQRANLLDARQSKYEVIK